MQSDRGSGFKEPEQTEGCHHHKLQAGELREVRDQMEFEGRRGGERKRTYTV